MEAMNNNNNVYYKVLNKDMESPYQDFQYELNKTYSTDKELKLCENGFHACKDMYEMIIYVQGKLKDCKFFECTLGDKIIEDDHKVVSNSIRLTKEIPFEEVDKSIRENLEILVHDSDDWVRATAAMQGYGLDILINDKDVYIRATVARRRYGLDILVHDENYRVRAVVAEQGYGLDILINDKSWQVRHDIARQRYKLDVLINDENPYVRAAVADQGYDLDTLIHDEDWFVRATVAQQGYSLDTLINDKDRIVKGIRTAILDDDKHSLFVLKEAMDIIKYQEYYNMI